MTTLNLGILAHVDAGKTTLTERLLFAAGVIDSIGSVDAGNTQTDSLELERRRGITIRSAVVSFRIGELTVNLIDTPGHPDFIAEVERVLGVLDGAVLVVSAVEGVQAQTRILMRTLQRLRVPTLLFVNKIDRPGARSDGLLRDIAERLTPAIVPMGRPSGLGTPGADFQADDVEPAAVDVLSTQDDEFLAAYLAGPLPDGELHRQLAAQTARSWVHPVFFGSAATGAGVDALRAGIADLLPGVDGDPTGPVSGSVFKVERGAVGEKIAYARISSGTLHVRDRLKFGVTGEAKVTGLAVFDVGAAPQRESVPAGRIAKLWGLAEVRIGDAIGVSSGEDGRHYFPPPTLETVIVPRRRADKGALHVALTQLTEQDPLINLRQNDIGQELFVSLYGEVQKEVIETTLAEEFGLEVEFRETSMICVERPVGTGAAIELMGRDGNPFPGTIGLELRPGAVGSGLEFRLEVKVESIPMYVYKTIEEFRSAMTGYVRDTLQQGLNGWPVVDCIVTMTASDYSSPNTTAGAFRRLTPLVVMAALRQAGTVVCEPIQHFRLDIPADTLGTVLPALAKLEAVPQAPVAQGPAYVLEGQVRAARVHELQQQLPALTRGEGVLEAAFDHYHPVRGTAPSRPRTDLNPLNRKEYLLHVERGL
ncbi:MAG TPA: translation factor GTPase family protein [Mycobacteriales bacterium]|nr:translation factor GTPase family protein [Mycobacteriales bacterium]